MMIVLRIGGNVRKKTKENQGQFMKYIAEKHGQECKQKLLFVL